jgi:CDP-glucose 4,6-dehydratase
MDSLNGRFGMNEVFDGFFKDRKVLITGHTGFKGGWLTLWLLKLGANVCGISNKPEDEKGIFSITNLQGEINHNICDINNLQEMNAIMSGFEPEIVFHMAAQPLVRLSYEDPITTFQTNVIGTANVLECVRSINSVRSVICITTDKCYENNEWVYGYRENDKLGGYDPYSSSKACAELLISSYRNSFFHVDNFGKSHHVALASVRAGNVIGGGDWAKDRIIPDCIRSFQNHSTLELRNPEATRPWQHVLEPLYGYMLLAVKLFNGEKMYSGAWNFGPTTAGVVKVKDIAMKILDKWGKGYIELGMEQGPHEARLLTLDISKAMTYLNWTPTLDIDETVGLIVEWYKADDAAKKKISLKQIEYFQSKIKRNNQ